MQRKLNRYHPAFACIALLGRHPAPPQNEYIYIYRWIVCSPLKGYCSYLAPVRVRLVQLITPNSTTRNKQCVLFLWRFFSFIDISRLSELVIFTSALPDPPCAGRPALEWNVTLAPSRLLPLRSGRGHCRAAVAGGGVEEVGLLKWEDWLPGRGDNRMHPVIRDRMTMRLFKGVGET